MKVDNLETATNTVEVSNECELSDADLMAINGGVLGTGSPLDIVTGLLGGLGGGGGTDPISTLLATLGLVSAP